LTAYFYHLMPAEVAVRFDNGLAVSWLSRQMTLVLALLPQLLLALIGLALAWVLTRVVNRSWPTEGTKTNPKTIVAIMGNMVALPQIVFGFAMADIFVYNAYQIHLPALWILALVIMVAGGIIIGVVFTRAIRRERSGRKR
jgi:ABC-type sulfate transport system permease component